MPRLPLLVTCALSWGAVSANAQVAVTTWHNDNARNGLNPKETILTPAAVSGGHFGLRCSYPVDGQIYAQPLVVPSVTVNGTVHDLVIVATEHDSVYAFDANCNGTGPLWHTSFLGAGITTMPCAANTQPQCNTDIISPERGITSTPVIKLANQTVYVAAQTVEQGVYTQKLHALALNTGTERPGSPVVVQGNSGGPNGIPFDPSQALQRAGLLLFKGEVYIAYASNDSASGWLFGYDTKTLTQRHVFCTTPSGSLGGIWSGGAAPATDGTSIYLATGNGTFNANVGGSNYGESVLRLVPQTNGTIQVADYFSPLNEATLSADDYDISTNGVVLLPKQSGTHPYEALVADKIGRFFLLDRTNLGQFGNHYVQSFVGGNPYIFSTFALWENNLYNGGVDGVMQQWKLSNGLMATTPAHTGSLKFNFPGVTPSVSSNGGTGAIVWILESSGLAQGGPPALLEALDATNITNIFYTNGSTTGGPSVKFAVPTVANGHVYVGTQTELDVYGLN